MLRRGNRVRGGSGEGVCARVVPGHDNGLGIRIFSSELRGDRTVRFIIQDGQFAVNQGSKKGAPERKLP